MQSVKYCTAVQFFNTELHTMQQKIPWNFFSGMLTNALLLFFIYGLNKVFLKWAAATDTYSETGDAA
jgi:hypothetical protein